MLKNLSLDNVLKNEPPTSELNSQEFTSQTKKIFKFFRDQDPQTHHILKKRNSAAWRLYYRFAERESTTLNSARVKLKTKFKFIRKFQINYPYRNSRGALYLVNKNRRECIALKSPGFNFEVAYKNRNKALYLSNKILKRCLLLQSLNIHIYDHSDKSLTILSRGFRAHISLKKITLSFNFCVRITNKGLKNLCKAMKNLIFLQILNLKFSNWEKITDEGLLYIEKLLHKLKNLQRISLDFQHCRQVSLRGVNSFIQAFQIIHPLHRILVSLHTEKGGVQLHGLLQQDFNSPILLKIKVGLRARKGEPNDLKSLLKIIPPVQNLSLKYVEPHEIRNYEWKIWRKVLEILVSLQSINIKFSGYEKITDGDLKKIISSLESFAKIKSLSFKFPWNNKVGEKEFKYLSQGLESLAMLPNFSFDFSPWLQVNDLGIKCLVQSLKKLNCLQDCRIGRDEVTEILKEHKSLDTVKSDFGYGVKMIEVEKDQSEDQGQEKKSIRSRSLFAKIFNFLKKIKRN